MAQTKVLPMTDKEKQDLWNEIQTKKNPEDWAKTRKEQIIKRLKPDKEFKKKVQNAWVAQQMCIFEENNDPLESEVLDENGLCLANRLLPCEFKDCLYKEVKGNRIFIIK